MRSGRVREAGEHRQGERRELAERVRRCADRPLGVLGLRTDANRVVAQRAGRRSRRTARRSRRTHRGGRCGRRETGSTDAGDLAPTALRSRARTSRAPRFRHDRARGRRAFRRRRRSRPERASSFGISSGGFWRSSSSVTMTSHRAARTPASSALCWPKLRDQVEPADTGGARPASATIVAQLPSAEPSLTRTISCGVPASAVRILWTARRASPHR